MTSRDWKLVDSKGEVTPVPISNYFQIFAPPKTDIWRPSTKEDHFNAPFIYTAIKSSAFKSMSVTVSADWKTLYDQGGLFICWPDVNMSKSKWFKIGIEHFNGRPAISVVGCDRFSDWSLCPLPMLGANHAMIEAERVETTLWIYFIFNGERRALREVKWAFLEDREAEAEMWVGTYAAKPTPEPDNAEIGIEVVFRHFKLETAE